MISVDEGATYEYVLNDAGEKIKAAGSEANVEEAIGNYVKVDEEGYICIGEYKTSFKYNANVPSMIYNEKDGTMQVTIGGQSYTLLMEGSAFNGLQSIAFRKPYADNSTVGSSEVAKLDIYNWFKKADGSGWEYRKATREDEEYNSENWKNDPILDPENSQEPFRLVDVVTGLGEKQMLMLINSILMTNLPKNSNCLLPYRVSLNLKFGLINIVKQMLNTSSLILIKHVLLILRFGV